jgi:hypothetical protein
MLKKDRERETKKREKSLDDCVGRVIESKVEKC